MTDVLILTSTITFVEDPALDEAIDNLIEMHRLRLRTKTDCHAHDATPRPEIKSAYRSHGQYLEDERAQEEWFNRRKLLAHACDLAWQLEWKAISEVGEYLPFDIWFKHGDLAIAITQKDEESAPQVVIDEWNDEWMPDLRNDETRASYLSTYSQIVA